MQANLPEHLPDSLTDDIGKSKFENPCIVASRSSKNGQVIEASYVEGCPVLVNVGGVHPHPGGPRTTDVVLAHNDLSLCGDKCIVGNAGSDRGTVASNHFHDAYYSALILMSQNYDLTTETAPSVRYTFYENHMDTVLRRNPRCASFVWCHDFNNVISEWGTYAQSGFGLSGTGSAQVYAENNFFAPPSSYGSPSTCDPATRICSKGNPAIDSYLDNNHPAKTSRGPGLIYNTGWALVVGGVVHTPEKGFLWVGPYPLNESSEVFHPANFYSYEAKSLDQATHDAIVLSSGPRQ